MRSAISAVRLKPELAEYWHNAASLANMLGFSKQAIEFVIAALRLDPKSRPLHVNLATLLVKTGRIDEALEVLDAVSGLYPEDVPISRPPNVGPLPACGPRQSNRDSANGGPPQTVADVPIRASAVGEASLVGSLRVQFRVLSGLVLRALSHRAIELRLGLLTLLFEPVLQIVAVGVILALFNRSRPPLGTHFFFFYATGLIPLYLFIHVVNHTMHVFVEHRALLQIPVVRRLDLVVSEAVAELLICGATGILTFVGFNLIGWAPNSEESDGSDPSLSGAVHARIRRWFDRRRRVQRKPRLFEGLGSFSAVALFYIRRPFLWRNGCQIGLEIFLCGIPC